MDKSAEFAVVSQIISALEGLDKEKQVHIINTVTTWLKIDIFQLKHSSSSQQIQPSKLPKSKEVSVPVSVSHFTTNVEMTPKQFMLEKQPRTDVERLACLAYYLTHYRDTPQFRTIDLSKLNTEAAQRKFSNAAVTAKNAIKTRYFVPASKKGHRQLSAEGEQIIAVLPDREAASAIRKRMRPRRTTKKDNIRKTKFASK